MLHKFVRNEKFILYNIYQNTKYVIATTAVGESYFKNWENYSKSFWTRYSDKYDIGLIIIVDDLIDKEDKHWKNAAWQKLLIPKFIKKTYPNVNQIAIIDTDIIISPIAPNIFNEVSINSVGVVSQEKNLPFSLDIVKKKIAYLRKSFIDENYPLDSILFASPDQIFELHGLLGSDNYFCAGLVVIGEKYFDIFSEWFYRIDSETAERSAAWEEPYLNNWVQHETEVTWLDYKYQAIWNFEMAHHYPFLYEFGAELKYNQIALNCIKYNLWENYFLHFAGSWFESYAWYNSNPYDTIEQGLMIKEFEEYRNTNPKGVSLGKILPKMLGS